MSNNNSLDESEHLRYLLLARPCFYMSVHQIERGEIKRISLLEAGLFPIPICSPPILSHNQHFLILAVGVPAHPSTSDQLKRDIPNSHREFHCWFELLPTPI